MASPVVTIARTRDDVEGLREIWNASSVTHIDSDIDYFLAVTTHAEQVLSPYVIHICRTGEPDILVVARLENLPVPLRLAYWKFVPATLRTIVVTFEGVLGARGQNDERFVMRELRRLIDRGDAELILMRNVDPRSTLHAAATGSVGALRQGHGQPIDGQWTALLPNDFRDLLSIRSAKSRSTLRRQDRLLREEFGDRLTLRRFRQLEEMDELCHDMEQVASRTYQGGLGVGFTGSPMERAVVSLGLSKGTYRCWMLYVDERPVAFWSGTTHGGTFHIGTPGFDPDFSRHSIGRYTMFQMMEDLCADETISRIDFGRGDARYKTECAASTGMVTDVWLAASRLRPMLAVGALAITAGINNIGRRWVRDSDWTRRIKTSWRRRLARVAEKS